MKNKENNILNKFEDLKETVLKMEKEISILESKLDELKDIKYSTKLELCHLEFEFPGLALKLNNTQENVD